jgi:hypothetical protein
MNAFILGAAGFVILAAMFRFVRHRRAGWRGRPGGWRRYALYSLFERLDATPGQEKVIAGALDELRDTLRALRERFQDSRHDVATAFRQPELTEEDLNRVFSRFDEHLEAIRHAAGAAMQKIHVVLDDRQRGVMADLVERGFTFGPPMHHVHRRCGGWRHAGFADGGYAI